MRKPLTPDLVSPEYTITAIYRSLLGRAPDTDGLSHFADALAAHGLEAVLASFVASAEFRARAQPDGPILLQLNAARAMDVEVTVSDEHLSQCWRHIAKVWSGLGEADPLWSVITDPRLQRASAPTPQDVDDFYSSGRHDVSLLEAYFSRAGLNLSDFPVVGEYGCGVGRVTRWLAPQFRIVKAFDISRPHLEMAERHLRDASISNFELIHMRDRGDLAHLAGMDLFFSMLVLQHNPPPIILDVLRHAFVNLNPHGVAFFQVPTYATDYTFHAEHYLREAAIAERMEMHFVPQADLLRLADDSGMRVLEVRPDHCIGNFNRWLSHTFLMRKR